MVITGVENGSPDMIPVAFDRKFDERKMRCLPGFVDLIYLKLLNVVNLRVDKKHKNGHNSSPWGSPMARIWHVP